MAIAAGNFVTTTTREKFFPKAVDNVFEGNILFNRLRGKARPWTGGHRMVISLTVSERNQGGSFSGFDQLSTTQEDVRQRATIDPSEYYWPVVFSGIQLATNKGPEAFLNLVAEEFSDTARSLSEKLGEDLYLDGTGNASKDISGLVYHIDDGRLSCVVKKFGYMLEQLVKLLVPEMVKI